MPSTSRPAGCQAPALAGPWPPKGTRAVGAGNGGRGPGGRGAAARSLAAECVGTAGEGEKAPLLDGPVSPAIVQAASTLTRLASSTVSVTRRALRAALGLIIPKRYPQLRSGRCGRCCPSPRAGRGSVTITARV